jgi:GTPase SAR1 family protein
VLKLIFMQDDELLPIVAVIGASGVGKSTFIRQCIKDGNPKPLAAPPQSATSTSADIHAYIGSLSDTSNVLLLDSEGNRPYCLTFFY